MRKLFLITTLVTGLAVVGATAAMAGKQTICHFPPGNPDNWHTIVVSDKAVADHVEQHGDLIGSCAAGCEHLCDDGDFCTQDVQSNDNGDCVCYSGTRPAVDCDDSNECTADSCSSELGACVNDTDLNDGNQCDDGDPGTSGTICDSGVCLTDIPFVYGDSNQDGVFNPEEEFDLSILDYLLLFDWFAGVVPIPPPEDPAFIASDVNGDGFVNFADVDLYTERLIGNIHKFPVEE